MQAKARSCCACAGPSLSAYTDIDSRAASLADQDLAVYHGPVLQSCMVMANSKSFKPGHNVSYKIACAESGQSLLRALYG